LESFGGHGTRSGEANFALENKKRTEFLLDALFVIF
jgi:hypothetical protein